MAEIEKKGMYRKLDVCIKNMMAEAETEIEGGVRCFVNLIGRSFLAHERHLHEKDWAEFRRHITYKWSQWIKSFDRDEIQLARKTATERCGFDSESWIIFLNTHLPLPNVNSREQTIRSVLSLFLYNDVASLVLSYCQAEFFGKQAESFAPKLKEYEPFWIGAHHDGKFIGCLSISTPTIAVLEAGSEPVIVWSKSASASSKLRNWAFTRDFFFLLFACDGKPVVEKRDWSGQLKARSGLDKVWMMDPVPTLIHASALAADEKELFIVTPNNKVIVLDSKTLLYTRQIHFGERGAMGSAFVSDHGICVKCFDINQVVIFDRFLGKIMYRMSTDLDLKVIIGDEMYLLDDKKNKIYVRSMSTGDLIREWSQSRPHTLVYDGESLYVQGWDRVITRIE